MLLVHAQKGPPGQDALLLLAAMAAMADDRGSVTRGRFLQPAQPLILGLLREVTVEGCDGRVREKSDHGQIEAVAEAKSFE